MADEHVQHRLAADVTGYSRLESPATKQPAIQFWPAWTRTGVFGKCVTATISAFKVAGGASRYAPARRLRQMIPLPARHNPLDAADLAEP